MIKYLIIWTLFINIALASQQAVVASEKAIIYADMKQEHPIGYLPKWKRIKVGDIARNAGQVVPIVISGKVAYIKTDDISVAREMNMIDQRFSRFGRKDSLYAPKTHDISFGLTNYMGTTKTYSDLGSGLNFFGMSFKWNYRWDYKRDLRFGAEASTVQSADGVTIVSYTLTAEVTYRVFKWWGVEGRALASLKVSPVTSVQSSSFVANGYAAGAGVGGELKKEFAERWVARSELGYFANQLYVDLPDPFAYYSPLAVGPKFGISIGYYY
jgi:hypothetical protein